MTSPEQAAARYAVVTAVDQQLAQQAKAAWYSMNLNDLQGSFTGGFVPAVVPALTGAQTVAASFGAQSVAEATGQPVSVIPGAFAGHASNGRGLPGMLAQPLIQTYVDLAGGMDSGLALDRGWDSIDRMLATQVHDAARSAESVQMVEHRVTYYIRQVEPGACGRCLVLAGVHYKVNKGFLRHPHCRCFHIAQVSVYLDPDNGGRGQLIGTETPSPFRTPELQGSREIFDSMSAAEQDRAFTVNGAQAIRDGASIQAVVNARLGMTTADVGGNGTVQTTTVGTTRRGDYAAVRRAIDETRGLPTTEPGRKQKKQVTRPRLLPEEIYRQAKGDHDETIRMLIGNGYITEGTPAERAARYAAMQRKPKTSPAVDLTNLQDALKPFTTTPR